MSDVYKKGLSPQTRAVSSSRNRLYAISSEGNDAKVIGVVSSFNPSDNRNNEIVRGIGFGDQIAELVPGMSEPISISLNRTALYQMNLFQALGYKGGVDGVVRAIKHHRWPFDLRQEIVISEVDFTENSPSKESAAAGTSSPEFGITDSQKVIATLYAGCWFTTYSATFSVDTAIVSEDGSLNVTDIFAYSSGPQNPVADNGGSSANSTLFNAKAQR